MFIEINKKVIDSKVASKVMVANKLYYNAENLSLLVDDYDIVNITERNLDPNKDNENQHQEVGP